MKELVIYKLKVELVTVIEGDPETLFGEGPTFFAGFLQFTLDTNLIMLSVKPGGIKYSFLSLWFDSTQD